MPWARCAFGNVFPEWSVVILMIAGSPDAKLSFADGFDLLMVPLMAKLTAGCAE